MLALSHFLAGREFRISTANLDVSEEVSGMNEEKFRRSVEEAEDASPVSNILKYNVEVRRLRAHLGS